MVFVLTLNTVYPARRVHCFILYRFIRVFDKCLWIVFPCSISFDKWLSLQWRHYERVGVSNHWRFDYLLGRLFRRGSKKTSNLRVTCLYGMNSPVTGELLAQSANNAEKVSMWWRHHGWNHRVVPLSVNLGEWWGLDYWIRTTKHNNERTKQPEHYSTSR